MANDNKSWNCDLAGECMNNLERVKAISKEAYDFMIRLQTDVIGDGRYELQNGVYANVETYMSQPREARKFENHRKYIDVQIIIEGEEFIELFPVEKFSENGCYDDEKDISFFCNCKKGTNIKLSKGDSLIIFPGQAHMPCVQTDESVKVKKAVIKIPVDMLPKLLFMDVDGTLTDGKIYMGKMEEEVKAFNIKDGYAIANILPQKKIVPVIITGRESEIVSKRAEELGIECCLQNVKDKKTEMIKVSNVYGIYQNENGILPRTAYIGDDIPDYDCMKIAEKRGCPRDAVDAIKQISDFVSTQNGGDGAVREFIEWMSMGE